MPTGLPTTAITNLLKQCHFYIQTSVMYLQIPSWEEYKSSLSHAFHDTKIATKSTYSFLFLTLRPICILLGLIFHHLFVVLRILARHTLHHGIVSAKHGLIQLRVATKWFVAFQRGLSRTAVAIELGVLSVCIGLWFLRRWIRKKKCAERVGRWYRRKKRGVLRKYNDFVLKVSRTSLFLAMLLPHVLYATFVFSVKYIMPWLVTYFATKTYATVVISLIIPFVRTVALIHRYVAWSKKREVVNEDGEDNVNESKRDVVRNGIHSARDNKKKPSRTSKNTAVASKSTATTKKGKPKAAQRWLRASDNSSTSLPKSSPGQRGETSDKATTVNRSDEEEMRAISEEAAELIMYWTVYALLSALFRTFYLLPIIGRIIAAADAGTKPVRNAGRYRFSFRLSAQFMEEVKLIFFIWLRLLPTSLTGSNGTGGGNGGDNVKGKTSAWEKKAKRGDPSLPVYANRPLEILYNRMAPAAVSMVNSSTALTKRNLDEAQEGGAIYKVLGKLRLVLDLAVMIRLITSDTKRRIERTLAESAALLPGAVTLLMPGYFTEFGVIYVKAAVPAANSALSYDALKRERDGHDEIGRHEVESAMRYLKYWVIYTLLSALLSAFAPLLAWVPLSTHLVFLIWSFSQLESTTLAWYTVFEEELIAFGILQSHNGNEDNVIDVDKTVTVRLLRKLTSSLPSGAASSAVGSEEELLRDDANAVESVTEEQEQTQLELDDNREHERVEQRGAQDESVSVAQTKKDLGNGQETDSQNTEEKEDTREQEYLTVGGVIEKDDSCFEDATLINSSTAEKGNRSQSDNAVSRVSETARVNSAVADFHGDEGAAPTADAGSAINKKPKVKKS